MPNCANSEVAGKKNIQKQHVHKQLILFTAWYMHIYMQLKHIYFSVQYTGIVLYTNAFENQRQATRQKLVITILVTTVITVFSHQPPFSVNVKHWHLLPHRQDLGEVRHFFPDLKEATIKNGRRKTKRIKRISQKQDNLAKPHCAWVSSK